MKILSFFLEILTILSLSIVSRATNSNSFIIYDVNTNAVINGNNINERALIASTTKILTAIITIENTDIMSTVEVLKEDTLIEGSKVYLRENEHFTVLDILHGLMLRSGNDCANLLARTHHSGYQNFISLMNKKCQELGMSNSIFKNPSGLDSQDENYSTAYDMALLMSYAIKNEYFKEISSKHSYTAKSIEGTSYFWANKDKSVLSDERFICGKTGYTKASGRILVNYAKAYSRDVIIVTINDSNDWINHKTYLNSLEKYVDYDIIKKGIYQVKDTSYIVNIKKDIKIPLLKTMKNSYTYIIYIGNKSYLYVYLHDLFINRYEVFIE